MSNTRHKGITDIEPWGEPYFKVSVQWRRKRVVVYVPKWKYKNALRQAVIIRNRIERKMGKPRTEKMVRSSGVFHQRRGSSDEIIIIEWSRDL